MCNKRFLIILTLLLSLLLVMSSVSAEEISDIAGMEEDATILDEDISSVDNEVLESDDVEEVIANDDVEEVSEPVANQETSSKVKLGSSDEHVVIEDVTVYEDQNISLNVKTNYTDLDYIPSFYIDVYDSDLNNVFSWAGILQDGENTFQIPVGKLPAGSYSMDYYDDEGVWIESSITVNKRITQAKVTVSSYSSYYQSGKTFTIKVLNKSNNKPISKLKLKLTYTSKGKSKVYYVTTNAKGIAKPKVTLGVGTYKLTVSSTSSKVKFTNVHSTVKVRKMSIKITVPNYSSYYKSGKKLTVKVVNNHIKKGVSVKLKFSYKKPKSKNKVYYVTTNAKGIAKIKIPVGIGKYKLTVTPASSNYKAAKVSKKVNVNKYVVFKAGKYKGKLTYKQVLALKKAKANGKDKWYNVFTGKYYTYKEPIYKTVKVKDYYWDYKYKLASEDWWDEYGSDWETYNPKTPKGYTLCGTIYKSGDGWSKTYYKYKKKVYYWTTKEVKTGKSKTVKDKIYMSISTNSGDGQYGKGDIIEVWSSGYWYVHEKNIITKKIKL